MYQVQWSAKDSYADENLEEVVVVEQLGIQILEVKFIISHALLSVTSLRVPGGVNQVYRR